VLASEMLARGGEPGGDGAGEGPDGQPGSGVGGSGGPGEGRDEAFEDRALRLLITFQGALVRLCVEPGSCTATTPPAAG
jgi:hypothetical protein